MPAWAIMIIVSCLIVLQAAWQEFRFGRRLEKEIEQEVNRVWKIKDQEFLQKIKADEIPKILSCIDRSVSHYDTVMHLMRWKIKIGNPTEGTDDLASVLDKVIYELRGYCLDGRRIVHVISAHVPENVVESADAIFDGLHKSSIDLSFLIRASPVDLAAGDSEERLAFDRCAEYLKSCKTLQIWTRQELRRFFRDRKL